LVAALSFQIIQAGSKVEHDDILLDTLQDAYIELMKQKYMQVGTTENHAQKYRSDLMEGKRVIVFAHSQGNLFANAAVENVIAENPEHASSIGIIGVATPADRVIGGNVYFTAHDDRVKISTLDGRTITRSQSLSTAVGSDGDKCWTSEVRRKSHGSRPTFSSRWGMRQRSSGW
jgi:hypothetical protein